jgi:hypothetical protein
MTQLVDRLVLAAIPSAILDLMYMYGIPRSSHVTGMCEMTSNGEISAESRTRPGEFSGNVLDVLRVGVLRSALQVSLTPR